MTNSIALILNRYSKMINILHFISRNSCTHNFGHNQRGNYLCLICFIIMNFSWKIYAILFQVISPNKLCYCVDSQVFKYNSVFIIGIRHTFWKVKMFEKHEHLEISLRICIMLLIHMFGITINDKVNFISQFYEFNLL